MKKFIKILAVTKKNEQRYVITDPVETVIDDAQGHGFRTEANAVAYAKQHDWVVINLPTVESNSLF